MSETHSHHPYEGSLHAQDGVPTTTVHEIGWPGDATPTVNTLHWTAPYQGLSRFELDRLYARPQDWIEAFEKGPLNIENINEFIQVAQQWGSFGVARAAKERAVAQGAPQSVSIELIEDLQYGVDYSHYKIEDHHSNVLGSYRAGEFLSMNPASIDTMATQMSAQFEGLSVAEARMVATTHVAAHEAGHTLLNATGRRLNVDRAIGRRSQLGSALYLAGHPEEYATGNWATDKAVFEERFAEGFAAIATDEMLRIMGASEDERTKILQYLADEVASSNTAAPGEFALDYLTDTQIGAKFSDTAQQQDLQPHEHFDIMIGYETKLDPDQVVDVFENYFEVAKTYSWKIPEEEVIRMNQDYWSRVVAEVHNPTYRKQLEDMAIERYLKHVPEKDKRSRAWRIGRRIGRIAASVSTAFKTEQETPVFEPAETATANNLVGMSRLSLDVINRYRAARERDGQPAFAPIYEKDKSSMRLSAGFSVREKVGTLQVPDEALYANGKQFNDLHVHATSDGRVEVQTTDEKGISARLHLDQAGDITAIEFQNPNMGTMSVTEDHENWEYYRSNWAETAVMLLQQLEKRALRGDNVLLPRTK